MNPPPITEVSARRGHRRWVYGPLDPSREPVIKYLPLAFPSDTFLRAFDDVTVLQRALMFGRFPTAIAPGMCSAPFVSPGHEHEITAAEYRAQGIH